jgi:hypothetical protein
MTADEMADELKRMFLFDKTEENQHGQNENGISRHDYSKY